MDDCLIGFAIFWGEAWREMAEIIFLEFRVVVDLSGEEAPAEWAEGNEADAEFFERGDHFTFRLPEPERIFVLKRGGGLHFVRAADCLHACFGKTEVFYFALLDQVFHCASDFFNGDV